MVREGNVLNISTPISDEVIGKLNIKDRLESSAKIFCGRDNETSVGPLGLGGKTTVLGTFLK